MDKLQEIIQRAAQIDESKRSELRERIARAAERNRERLIVPPPLPDLEPEEDPPLVFPLFCNNPDHELSWGEESCMACFMEQFNESQRVLSSDSVELAKWKRYFLHETPWYSGEPCPACTYEGSKLIKKCALHTKIANLEQELNKLSPTKIILG